MNRSSGVNHERHFPMWRELFVAIVGGLVVLLVPTLLEWAVHRNDPPPPRQAEVVRNRETAIVEALRPGGREADLALLMGRPAASQLERDGFQRTVFVLDNAAVLAISDDDGRVLLTSVTSLTPAFHPTFRLDDGSVVQMWKSHPVDVQRRPSLVIGNVGANLAWYFEWTPGPDHSTNYRRGLYGYTNVYGEAAGDKFSVFTPFLFESDGRPREVMGMGIPHDVTEAKEVESGTAEAWAESPLAASFRARLPINTVAFQAADVDAMEAFPAAMDSEVWPYITVRTQVG